MSNSGSSSGSSSNTIRPGGTPSIPIPRGGTGSGSGAGSGSAARRLQSIDDLLNMRVLSPPSNTHGPGNNANTNININVGGGGGPGTSPNVRTTRVGVQQIHPPQRTSSASWTAAHGGVGGSGRSVSGSVGVGGMGVGIGGNIGITIPGAGAGGTGSRHALGGGTGAPPWPRAVSASVPSRSSMAGIGGDRSIRVLTNFEPRIVRGNERSTSVSNSTGSGATGAGAASEGRSGRNAPAAAASPTRARRASTSASTGPGRRAPSATRPVLSPSTSAGANVPPAPSSLMTSRPLYMQHSALRDLIQPEAPSSLPPSRYTSEATYSAVGAGTSQPHGPSSRRDITPGPLTDSDDDSESAYTILSGGRYSRRPSASNRGRARDRDRERQRSLTAALSASAGGSGVSAGTGGGGSSSSSGFTQVPIKTVLKFPTRFSELDRHQSLSVLGDGRDLIFHGPSCSGEKEAAAARTHVPIPAACGVFYYEVEIKSKGQKGHISIGFSASNVILSRLPGWEKNSWGYHGDDGKSFASEKDGTKYGPTFSTGDVIGCGIDFSNYRAFYTKNGTFLGYVFENVGRDTDLYPSIGLRTAGEEVHVNFGQEEFRFEIDLFVGEVGRRAWDIIQSVPVRWRIEDGVAGGGAVKAKEEVFELGKDKERVLDAVKGSASSTSSRTDTKGAEDGFVPIKLPDDFSQPLNRLVMSYLSHHGYERTARALEGQIAARKAPAASNSSPSLTSGMGIASGAPGAGMGMGMDTGRSTGTGTGTGTPSKIGAMSVERLISASNTNTTNLDVMNAKPVPSGAEVPAGDVGMDTDDGHHSHPADECHFEMDGVGVGPVVVESASPESPAPDTSTPTALRASSTPAPDASTSTHQTSESLSTASSDLRARQLIVTAVSRGAIDTALTELETRYPSVLARDEGLLLFKLRCRKFVELMVEAGEAGRRVREGDQMREEGRVREAGKVDGAGMADGLIRGGGIAGKAILEDGAMEVDDEDGISVPNGTATSFSNGAASVPPRSLLPTSPTPPTHTLSPSPSSSSSTTTPSPTLHAYQTALSTALSYGKDLQTAYRGDTRPSVQALFKSTFSLVAYDDPVLAEDNGVRELVSQGKREELAGEVNVAILESQGRPSQPALERMYRQSAAVLYKLGLLGVGRAAFADMEKEFRGLE